MKTEQILYGTKKGKPDYMEDVISTKPENFEKAIEWAKRNRYDRLRIAEIDLSIKPDFKGTIA